MQKIAILGGTFNPIHLGHLQIAATALAQLSLQRVLWVPVPQPFHKSQTDSASFEQRFEMVKLAVANRAGFELCLSHSGGNFGTSAASYAIDMLQMLKPVYPHSQWYWLLGQDALQTLPRWKGRQELAETCCWLVAPRSAQAQTVIQTAVAQAQTDCNLVAQAMLAQAMPIRWQVLQMLPTPISSSMIRQHRRQGDSIQGLVPDCVEQYILAHRLYELA
jgi:nicotinate-nucleotide adenylyltransferase